MYNSVNDFIIYTKQYIHTSEDFDKIDKNSLLLLKFLILFIYHK